MPGFDVAVAGVVVENWTDESASGLPCRLNQPVGSPALRYVATVGAPVVITATLDGATAPLDVALDGRLFSAVTVESPAASASPVGVAGQSSVQSFTPQQVGHYLLRMTRARSGSWFIPFDAVAP